VPSFQMIISTGGPPSFILHFITLGKPLLGEKKTHKKGERKRSHLAQIKSETLISMEEKCTLETDPSKKHYDVFCKVTLPYA
jgi:hypothetical protein